jgi:hypothetical protein
LQYVDPGVKKRLALRIPMKMTGLFRRNMIVDSAVHRCSRIASAP